MQNFNKLDIIIPVLELNRDLVVWWEEQILKWDRLCVIFVAKFVGDDLPIKNCILIQGGQSIYDAMNVGIKNSTGSHLFFCGDDDQPNVSTLIETCEQFPNYDLILGYVKFGKKTPVKSVIAHSLFNSMRLCYFLTNSGHNHQAMILRRTKQIHFNVKYQIIEDNVLFWKLFIDENCSVKFVQQVFGLYGTSGFSSRNRKLMRSEWSEFYWEVLSRPKIKIIAKFLLLIRVLLVAR